MKTTLSLLLLLTITSLSAQFSKQYRSYGDFEIGENVLLFGDNVNLRAEASTSGEVISRLPIAQKLKILEIGSSATINGLALPWVKITTIQKGKNISGWLWSGLICQLVQEVKGGELFLLGVKEKKDYKLTVEVRAVRDGKLLDQLSFQAVGDLGYYVAFPMFGGKGLEGIHQIVQPTFSYEACGYTNGEITLLWDGNKLFNMGKTTNWADAGVGHTDQTFIFPEDEMGRPKQILLVEEDSEEDEIGNINLTQKTTVWRWNGTKLVKMTYEDMQNISGY